ncbi:MAG: N-acetyltransferase [Balneolaceae bacterium]|nr:N-acetyltransferase [Balneolaceae bacterium]MCH8549920.1 N-acetyltransferase [Balneolaceae bacterium]
MNIQHKSGETKGEFYLEVNGVVKAKMTYSKLGNTQIIIDHTEVDEDLHGENAGKAPVEAGVEHVRKNNLKVIPLCPFAKAMIQRDESLQDVLRK